MVLPPEVLVLGPSRAGAVVVYRRKRRVHLMPVGRGRQRRRRRLLGLLLVRRRDHDVRLRGLDRLLVLLLLVVSLVQHARNRRWRQLLILHGAAHRSTNFHSFI